MLTLSKEILSGEVTTPRARRVLYPILVVYLLNFVSSAVRWQLTGYSGFTAGTLERGNYAVIEHGHIIHLTAGQYWLGRMQILILFLGLIVWFCARAYFARTGDLRIEKKGR